MTSRVEILGGKECSFFEVIQKTLLEVSARKLRYSVPEEQTLMVDVMEYLRMVKAVSFDYTSQIRADLHCRSFIITSYGQEEERDQLKAILKYIVNCPYVK